MERRSRATHYSPSSEPEARSASINWPCRNSGRRSSRSSATVSPRPAWCSPRNDSTLRGLHVWGFTGTNVAFVSANDAEVLQNLIGANPAFGDPGPGLRAGINLLLDGGNKPSVRNNLVGYASGSDNVLVTDQGEHVLVEGNELVGSLRLSTEALLGSRDPTAQPLHFGQPDQELGQLRPRPPWPDELHHQQQHGAPQRDWRGESRGYPPDQHGERYVEDQCSRPEHRHRQPGAGHSRYR